jgi:hypothetical protein
MFLKARRNPASVVLAEYGILDDEPDLLSEVGPAKDTSLRVVPHYLGH